MADGFASVEMAMTSDEKDDGEDDDDNDDKDGGKSSGKSSHSASSDHGQPQSDRKKGKNKKDKNDSDCKRCSICMQWKSKDEYSQGQGRCHECNRVERSLLQRAKTQGQSEYVASIKQSDEKQYRLMVKACGRQKAQAQKEHMKLKFSINVFRQQYKSIMGRRYQEISQMMWEGAFLLFCQSAEGGYLSEVLILAPCSETPLLATMLRAHSMCF